MNIFKGTVSYDENLRNEPKGITIYLLFRLALKNTLKDGKALPDFNGPVFGFSEGYLHLKVVGNEKEGGSGRWQMIGICLGPW
jgi:hypothetical protein